MKLASAQADDPRELLESARQIIQTQHLKHVKEALSLLERANQTWENSSSQTTEYVESLNYSTLILRYQFSTRKKPSMLDPAWQTAVAPFTKRALDICELNHDVKPEDLALALELQADVLGRDGAGAEIWNRAFEIRARRVAELGGTEAGSSSAEKICNGAAAKVSKVSAPTLVRKVQPEYSNEALLAFRTGTVFLSIVIDQNGAVSAICLVRGVGLGLDEKAAEAVHAWRFHPGIKEGTPVATQATVDVSFRLR